MTRRTDEADYSGFVFGKYGGANFVLLHLVDDATDADRPGPATFGLLVAKWNSAAARPVLEALSELQGAVALTAVYTLRALDDGTLLHDWSA